MFSLLVAVLRSLIAGFRARRNLVLENLALRHQPLVLNRKVKSPTLRNSDRLFWATLSAIWSRWTTDVGDRPTADRRALASGRIPALLALAITPPTGSHAEGS
jgi:hypothetical protein